MMKRGFFIIGVMLITALSTQAQGFSSGSTGADGPLDLTSGNRTVQLPESGVLNYTTVNIPTGRVLTFKRNSHNTPVYMLAQGNVTIAGGIDISAGTDPDIPFPVKTPGPGGFYGGDCNSPGFGPGGGTAPPSQDGTWVGPLTLVPPVGGSGGYGLQGAGCCVGGGGGGAIVIASSTTISVSGLIYANGGARVRRSRIWWSYSSGSK